MSKAKQFPFDEDFPDEHPVVLSQRGDFKKEKQTYAEEYPATIICKECQGDEFIVGSGNYFTAIKCKKCKWELCIHTG